MKLTRVLPLFLAIACGRGDSDVEFRDATAEAQDAQFTTFETEHVRPMALSADGKRLFVVNTPDNRVEVFDVEDGALEYITSISVGLEPVAVALSGDQAWVVNHLSDSISVVHIGTGARRYSVVRTLLVGDEPRDVVFAGAPGQRRAFVTTAHRGQNAPYDPQLTTASVGRADVWVFDANDLGTTLEGTPLSILSLYTDSPRGLAVSADGRTVYAAGFHTGNKTTAVSTAFTTFVGLPPPNTNFQGVPEPTPFGLGLNALIVKYDGTHWLDELGRIWDSSVNFTLADQDVFTIDADATPPVVTTAYEGVGTILFNLVVNPVSGKIYATNTEAFNEIRFEGHGDFTGELGVCGHLHESRITVIDPASGAVEPRHLNKHIDYSVCGGPVGSEESEDSLAFPTQAVVSADGQDVYVAAFGSSKVGVFSSAEVESDTFVPSAASHVEVSGGGPSGLVLDETSGRLFVTTRFDNAIKVIDTETLEEVDAVFLYNPEPASVIDGRPFLYDARFTSSHGDSACASCHVFGDFDGLAWDLGNPDTAEVLNPGPLSNPVPPFFPGFETFNPLKGPMVTQSLRGMANHGPMHWRGDRTGGFDEPSVQPDGGSFDEEQAFMAFNAAFVGLVGRDAPIPDEDMVAFTDFILQVTYPPNPMRSLDNSLNADEQAGADFYFGPKSLLSGNHNCNDCHLVDPDFNPDSLHPGLFGSDAMRAFTFQNQVFKNAHLRNAYQKVGMFGFPDNPFFVPGNNDHQGEQIRGYGYSHDGSVDTLSRFVSVFTFQHDPAGNPTGIPAGEAGATVRRQLEAYMLAFDTNLAPIVGQQATFYKNAAAVSSRIALLRERAALLECDLVAKVRLLGLEIGWLYDPNSQTFTSSLAALGAVDATSLATVAALAKQPLTYTCVPPGNGERIALDRDLDGVYDADEELAGTDPADSESM